MTIKTDSSTTTTIVDIIGNYFSRISPLHEELLCSGIYSRKWNTNHKKYSIDEFISMQRKKSNKSNVSLEDSLEYIKVPIDEIDFNPRNGLVTSLSKNYLIELDRLVGSMQRLGQLEDVRLMKKKDGRYTEIDGRKRILAASQLNFETVRAIVSPMLPKEEQDILIWDLDIFDTVDLNKRADSIARQYRLNKEKTNGELAVDEFVKSYQHKWSPKFMRDSIFYDSLPEEIKTMFCQSLITYGTAVEIAKIDGAENQKEHAISAAITDRKKKDIIISSDEKKQESLFSVSEMKEQKRNGEQYLLANNINYTLMCSDELIHKVLEDDRLRKEFLQENDIIKKFHNYVRILGEIE